jgi:hypothetical protein
VLFKEPGHKPWERQELTHSIHTLAFGLFVPFFFFAIGLKTDVSAIWNNFFFSVIITMIAIAGTVFGSAFGQVEDGQLVLAKGGEDEEDAAGVIGTDVSSGGDVFAQAGDEWAGVARECVTEHGGVKMGHGGGGVGVGECECSASDAVAFGGA